MCSSVVPVVGEPKPRMVQHTLWQWELANDRSTKSGEDLAPSHSLCSVVDPYDLKSKKEAGQKRPGGFRVLGSRASAPETSPKSKPPARPADESTPEQRVSLADFFGASPVASALDLRTERDPMEGLHR